MVVSLAIEARLSKLHDYVRNRKVILNPRPTDLYVVMSTNLGTARSPYGTSWSETT